MIEVIVAIVAGLGLCGLSFHAGHRHGHKCERKEATKAMHAMHEALSRAMEREINARVGSPWN